MEEVSLNMPAATLVRSLRSENGYFDEKEDEVLFALQRLVEIMDNPHAFTLHPEWIAPVLERVNDYWVLLRNLAKTED